MESFDFSQVTSSSTTCGSSPSVSGPHNPKLKSMNSFPRRRKAKSRSIHDHSTSDEGSLLESSLGRNNKTRISIKKGDLEEVAVVITRSKHTPTIKISIEFPEPETKRRRRLLRWKRSSSVPKTDRKSEMVSIEERVQSQHCPSCSCNKNDDDIKQLIPLCGLADVDTRPSEQLVDYIEDITNPKDCPKTDIAVTFIETTKTNNVTESSSSSNSQTPSDINSEGEVDCTTEVVHIDDTETNAHIQESNHMMSTWNLIHQRMTKQNSESRNSESKKKGDDSENEESELHKTLATKIVKEAIEKILLPEVQDQTSDDQSSVSSENCAEENRAESNASGSTKAPKHWSQLKKWILLQRFIGELEKVKKIEPKVNLRPLTAGGRKRSEEWMLDYALRQAVEQLAPTQKRKVALLVRAFETVAPTKADDEPLFVENQESEGENRIKMWHMVYRHVVSGIAKKVGSRLLDGAEDDEEVENDDALKLVKEAVCEIVEKPDEVQAKKRWSKVKNVVLLKRSIRALKKGREVVEAREAAADAGEGERVELRGRMLDEKIKAEQWMLDYALQHIVTKLTPARKRRVCMLVEAFDAVVPLPDM